MAVLVLVAYKAGQMSRPEGFEDISPGALIGIGVAIIFGVPLLTSAAIYLSNKFVQMY